MGRMQIVWSTQVTLERWARVETAHLHALVQHCSAPVRLSSYKYPTPTSESVDKFEKLYKHEMIAFLRGVSDLNTDFDAGLYLHLGLTSSDVVDTALSLAMLGSVNLLIGAHGSDPLLTRAREDAKYGKMLGAVGTGVETTLAIEAHALRELGLVPWPCPSQIIPRSVHASYAANLIIMSRRLGGERCPASWLSPFLENIATWHERDISHSSVERVLLPKICETLYQQVRRTT